ncbi:glutathione S-transferase [Fimicolochytrium jonesii]|uniref:glutathione S-transferase n=1 Tax=Fimicolochytrium jonesii TaxID=1396493 RepID=UPI0022FECE68|nr:glutathione S-transferase [Fimicolochytrium jonesii]KAI8824470.1 glutathione S-transferase [Fimicolochytrium jonesii]
MLPKHLQTLQARRLLLAPTFRSTFRIHCYPVSSAIHANFTSQRTFLSTANTKMVEQKDAAAASIFKWASKDGEFRRQVSSFRDVVSTEADAKFKAEPGRYHLYVSWACPWAHRAIIVRALKGLQDVIGLSAVHYLLQDKGWRFDHPGESTPGVINDNVNGAEYLRDIYFKAEPNYEGRFTVPVLWDKKTQTIVNNESSEIIRFLNTAFDEWSSAPGVSYYPENLRKEIDDLNGWIYDEINNGVYKAGFATTQEAYEKNYKLVFQGLDKVENILAKKEWLVGETFTEADIRLFTTIVRFDPVYHTHFKCTGGTIAHSYPNILRWTRQFYQLPKIAETVNMEHIKNHYYMSHIQINPTRVVPVWNGPDLTVPYAQK